MTSDCEILIGDVRTKLRELIAREVKVQCVVTSPPYWGLRDYGTEPQIWGGREDCAHAWGATGSLHRGGPQGRTGDRATRDTSAQDATGDISTGNFCQHCGAWRGELGLEPTPELFIAHIVEVFRLVREVLADDGTLWLNMGDCYAGSGWSGGTRVAEEKGELVHRGRRAAGRVRCADWFKPKDLVGQPWMVAFALRADDWFLRSDIIWHKPNPMPESIRDRPTKAHEYVFLLTKSARYYYDARAIKEPVTGGAKPRGNGVNPKALPRVAVPAGWDTSTGRGGHGNIHRDGARPRQNASFAKAVTGLVTLRNKRSVWTIPTEPYPEAHYATFPTKLVEPCVLAGSRPGDLVLDPFGGSGTTGQVAVQLGRRALLIDLDARNEPRMRARVLRRLLERKKRTVRAHARQLELLSA